MTTTVSEKKIEELSEKKIEELCEMTVKFFKDEKKTPYPDKYDLNAPWMCYKSILDLDVARLLGFDEVNGYELQSMMYKLRKFYASRDIDKKKDKQEMMEFFKNAQKKNIYVASEYWGGDSIYRRRHPTFSKFSGFFTKINLDDYAPGYMPKFSYEYTLEGYDSSESF